MSRDNYKPVKPMPAASNALVGFRGLIVRRGYPNGGTLQCVKCDHRETLSQVEVDKAMRKWPRHCDERVDIIPI